MTINPVFAVTVLWRGLSRSKPEAARPGTVAAEHKHERLFYGRVNRLVPWLVSGLMLTLSGCAGQPTSGNENAALQQVDALTLAGDFCGAAEVLYAEIPRQPHPGYMATKVRLLFLQRLGVCAQLRGATAESDNRAQQVHAEGVAKFAFADTQLTADFHHELANYYFVTARIGYGVPWLLQELPLRERLGEYFPLARVQTLLGFYHYIVGADRQAERLLRQARANAAHCEFAVADVFDQLTVELLKALPSQRATAKEFVQFIKTDIRQKNLPRAEWEAYVNSNAAQLFEAFQHGKKFSLSDGTNHMVGSDQPEQVPYDAAGSYTQMMTLWLQIGASRGDRAQLAEIYRDVAAKIRKHPALKAPVEQAAVIAFAEVGDLDNAYAGLASAKSDSDELVALAPGIKSLLEQQQTCSSGGVELAAGHYVEAIAALEQCIAQGENSDKTWNQASRTRYPTYLGLAYEASGDNDRAQAAFTHAVTAFEPMRRNIPLADRAILFREKNLRAPYWGLLRLAAKHAQQTQREADFFAALIAADQLRARQLGDVLAPDQALSATDLQALKTRLGSDQAVLIYTVMDKHWVLLGFDNQRHVVAINPIDAAGFNQTLGEIADALADETSNAVTLQGKLAQVGKLLLAPAASVLADKKQLLVLTDGALNGIPFDVLSLSSDLYRPLIQDYAIRTAPSLKLLAGDRERAATPAALFALGDPKYHARPGTADAAEPGNNSRFWDDRLQARPLPETRAEVRAVAAAFPRVEKQLLLGADASESQLKRIDFSRYGYLHFATHGILGGTIPGIWEPALILAEENGGNTFLVASDVERLHLNAELAVLSACETGEGSYIVGEGTLSMARAFMKAGARNLVASLWQVPSASTREIMELFYRQLQQGVAVDAALRNAKLAWLQSRMQRNEAASHPAYWAAFVLFGR
ncbi:CHAT domain-containing protein [Methylomonas sp. HW2-6]|uniref:CHAT domain-containing protein n=1 Tax=Methylomonas sp. HW2-6 TaxID=3376687 RepID=UPI004042D321